jgi:hypothetical protein
MPTGDNARQNRRYDDRKDHKTIRRVIHNLFLLKEAVPNPRAFGAQSISFGTGSRISCLFECR